jgi:hypothetical protein
MNRRLTTLLAALAVLAFLPALAQAQWSDDFESYTPGDGLHGQGGWNGWDLDPTFDALVTTDYAHSGMNSAAILGTTDIVQEFSGYTSGVWTLTCWQWVTANHTGQHYFILLNTYAPGGTNNWSTQVFWQDGFVTSDGAGETLPWITDQWVEIRVEIDLDNNMQTFYYDNTLLFVGSWTEGISGGGAVNIGAMDLFGNSSATVYYDDFSLTQGVVATEETSWSDVKNLYR